MIKSFFINENLLSSISIRRAAYSDRMSWLMAECSRLAYENIDNIIENKFPVSFKIKHIINNNETGTYGYVAVIDNSLVVIAFRGTENNYKDIITDLKVRFYKTKFGKVHSGFYNTYCNEHEKLKLVVDKYNNYPIYLTGHSLGGALSVIATAALANDNIASCYTFGCPKLGV